MNKNKSASNLIEKTLALDDVKKLASKQAIETERWKLISEIFWEKLRIEHPAVFEKEQDAEINLTLTTLQRKQDSYVLLVELIISRIKMLEEFYNREMLALNDAIKNAEGRILGQVENKDQ